MNKPTPGAGAEALLGGAPAAPARRRLAPAPPPAGLSMAAMHERIEAALELVEFRVPEGAERLAEAARYSLLGGGKRVRPMLVMAAAQALGAPIERVMPTACALELLHTNSLIVDDLPAMDNHAKRRGRPTLHRLYGDDVAILAGCALLSESQRLILEEQPGSADLRNRLLGVVREATGTPGMVAGQYLDVTGYEPRDRADLERMQMLKTGCLLVACVRCGALVATGKTDAILDDFAADLGSLFQVVDDILDETGKVGWLGKMPGSDRRAGKLTHVTMFGLAESRARATELHERSLASLEKVCSYAPGPTGPLREIADGVLRRRK